MMTGGRVMHHAMRVLPDENATLVFVGYQAAGTTGRRILDGEREVKIFKEWIPVRCRVEKSKAFPPTPIGKRCCAGSKVCKIRRKWFLPRTANPMPPKRWLDTSAKDSVGMSLFPQYEQTIELV
jgi:Cft2 family RNA processing exonuclease